MIQLTEHAEGVCLSIKAHPNAHRNALRGEQNGMLKVAVTQIAEKGKANKAIISFLSKSLGLRKSQLEIIAGHTNSEKQLLVRSVNINVLRELLRAKLSSG